MSRLAKLRKQEARTLRQSLTSAATRIANDGAVHKRKLFRDGSTVICPDSSGSLSGLGRRAWELVDFDMFTTYLVYMKQDGSSDEVGSPAIEDFRLAITRPDIPMYERGGVFVHTLKAGIHVSTKDLKRANLHIDHIILLSESLDALYTEEYLERNTLQ